MEAAKIEWERIESVFVEDDVYENMNAPQWIDLLSPLPNDDDVAWFCRPDCKHPTSAQDFLNSTSTPSSPFKLLRSPSVSKLIGLVDWTRREPNLKRRGGVPPPSTSSNDDTENQDPNFSTPNRQITYLNKAAIKSSAQKSNEDEFSEISLATHDQTKPTQPARDLFGKITEFCNDLKKMATRAKDNEDNLADCTPNSDNNCHKPLEEQLPKHPLERLPLLPLELRKDPIEGSVSKGKARKNKIRRADEAENIPVSLNLNNMKSKEEGKVLAIRTNPPTPQGFSATRGPLKARPCISPMGKEMVEEVVGQKKSVKEEDGETGSACIREGKEGRTLDVFWFFKPCTLST